MEKLEFLHQQLRNKETTHDYFLNFPKKIEYQCLVPLSKVAFSPGKIIHTNEFYQKKEKKMEIRSYYEASEELKQSIELLKTEIESINPHSTPPSPPPPPATTTTNSQYDAFVVQQTNFLNNLSTENFVLPKSEKEVEEQKHELEKKEQEDVQDDSQNGAVEIHETYDENGNVLERRVVDLSSEFNSTKSLLAQSSENQSLDDMFKKLQERLNLPTDQSDETSQQPQDADSQFIRELAEISIRQQLQSQGNVHSQQDHSQHHTDEEDILETLNRLESKEKSAIDMSNNETVQLKSSEREGEKEFLSSKAWKKGFLSSNKSEKKEKYQLQQPTQSSTPSPGHANRTTRGILKTAGQPKQAPPPTPIPPNQISNKPLTTPSSSSSSSSSMGTGAKNLQPPPPQETKRVSKFMTERRGGVGVGGVGEGGGGNENLNQSIKSTSTAFTGKIIERG